MPRDNIVTGVGGGRKANRGNRTPRTARQLAALKLGWPMSVPVRAGRREAGLAIARRYRLEQPFRALLDSIYGPQVTATTASYPFHDHRTCADWLEAA